MVRIYPPTPSRKTHRTTARPKATLARPKIDLARAARRSRLQPTLEDDAEFESESDASESSADEWDAEAALTALHDPAPPSSPSSSSEEDITTLTAALADALARANTAHRAALADTLLPATRAVRDAHAHADTVLDRRLAESVIATREAGVRFGAALVEAAPGKGGAEEAQGEKEDDIDPVRANVRLKELFADLQGRYRLREELQMRQHALVVNGAASVRAHIDTLPADLSALADRVRAKAKELDRADAQAADVRRKMLKGIMAQV